MKRQKHHENQENEDTGSRNHKDSLSDLPDSVLIHILSFLKTKDAVQTCLLSTRWKHLWKHLPTLTIHSVNFRWKSKWKFKSFYEFVNRVLSLRDASTALNVLDFHATYNGESDLVESIVRYAVSHNVNRLQLSCYTPRNWFPLSLFSCPSLTSLELFLGYQHEFPNYLNLPALNYLILRDFDFSFCSANDGQIEPFSTFNRLTNLILSNCTLRPELTLCVSSTTLLSLSINLSSSYLWFSLSKLELSTPNLCSFTFTTKNFLKLYGSSLDSIKKADIDVELMDMVTSNHDDTPLILLNALIELVNIKSLTVSTTTLRVLSLIPDILKVRPPSWNGLKSLKVKLDHHSRFKLSRFIMEERLEKERLQLHSSIPDGIIEFLLRNSPSVKVVKFSPM